MKARDIPSESVQPEELVQVFLERLRNPDQVRRLVHKEEWRIDPEMDRQHPPTVADRVLLIDRIFNLNLALHAARWSRHPRPLPGRKSRYMTSRDERCTADKHVLDMVTSIEELGYYAYIHIRRRNVPLNVGPDIVFMARSDEAGGHRRSYIGLRSGETFDEIWRSFA
jgi:hypothetical protein